MKDKILYLILGILIGAVVTAGCFLVFGKNKSNEMKNFRPDKESMENFDFENFNPENFDPDNMPSMPKGGKSGDREGKKKEASEESSSTETTTSTTTSEEKTVE